MDNKTDEAYQTIRSRIQEGYWRKGDPIFPERKLAGLLNVSRITVRAAIAQLKRQGILQKIEGKKGTYVANDGVVPAPLRCVCVAVDNNTPAFASLLLQGIHDAITPHGYQTIYCNTHFGGRKVSDDIVTSLLKNDISGLIIAPVLGKGSKEYNKRIIDLARKKGLPLVQVDRYVPADYGDYVGCDNHDATAQLVRMMIRHGKRHFLVVDGYRATSLHERLLGVEDTVSQNPGTTMQELTIDEEDCLFAKGIREKDVPISPDTDAVIGLNRQLSHAAREFRNLPPHVEFGSIASSENEADDEFSMIQPMYEIGKTAGELLMSQMANPARPGMRVMLKSRPKKG